MPVSGTVSILLALAAAAMSPEDGAPPIAITWSAPADCPSVDALRDEVRRIAGTARPPADRLEAEATVRREAGAVWQLTLKTRAGERAGERVLTAADCGELMHAAALVMALMINPQATLEVPAPAPRQPPAPPSPAAAFEDRFAAGAEVVVGSGALPGIAPGIALRFAAARQALSAEVRAGISMSRSTPSPADADAGGTFDLLDATLAGCARAWRTRRVSPGACTGVTLVRVHGSGYGVTDPGDAAAWWNAGLAEANLRLRFSPRNAVRLAAQALFSPWSPRFALAGVGRVFEPAPVWLRGTLGWEVHF